MLIVWFTVISWQKGIAKLKYQPNQFCQSGMSCKKRQGCNKWRNLLHVGSASPDILIVPIAQPLQVGQRVEAALAEKYLLQLALIFYASPLLLMMFAAVIGVSFDWPDSIIAATLLCATIVGCISSPFIVQSCVWWRLLSLSPFKILRITPRV